MRLVRAFGAEGIGLCRTEHMFFGVDRLPLMQEMILADTDAKREATLAALEPMQTADFIAIFREMNGKPVKIRLLDPPLHEFLPHAADEIAILAKRLDRSPVEIESAIAALREANPMLGLRGCRLGLIAPAITPMQTRAILRAAIKCASEGIVVKPEIMVSLVAEPEELRRQRHVIEETAETLFAETDRQVVYTIGTMIELPRAALLAGDIARYADFFSFGTNDLTQTTLGLSRDDAASFLPFYVEQGILAADPFQTLDQRGVGELITLGTQRGRAAHPGLDVGICGEHGGDPASIAFCHHAGLDYVSCSPFRLPVARLEAAHAALGQVARDL